MLADQGADVIVLKPSKLNSKSPWTVFFERGKTEIQLDLKKEKDKKFITQEIVPHIDVILESFRPGVMEKHGLVPEIIHTINPNVLYVRLSGYGKEPSKQTLQHGNDINYLAFTGILNKFKRIGKASLPVPPSNILGDFASGSLYCFNLILQALLVRKQYTVIDFSVSHALLYLTQPALLEGKTEIEFRRKPGDSSIQNFTRPHETVFRDNDGVIFVIKPGSKIYDDAYWQLFTQDDIQESWVFQDILQLVFEQMKISEIEAKYGAVEIMRSYDQVLEERKALSSGLIKKHDSGKNEIMNVFDLGEKQDDGSRHLDGWEALKAIGVNPLRVDQMHKTIGDRAEKAKLKESARPKL